MIPVEFITNDYGSGSQTCSLFTGGLPSSSTTPSALLELQSTTGTILLSRMTTVEIGALSATDGMIVYNTDIDYFLMRQGGAWVNIGSGSGSGSVTSVGTGTGLQGGPITITGTISIADTGVTSGIYDYPTLNVNDQGQITSISSNTPVTEIDTGTGLTGGPVTSTGTISIATD